MQALPHPRIWLAGLTALALVLLLFLVDPAKATWFPPCPFHWLTGFDCPGCGSSRGLHALLHGNPGRAADHNLLLLPALPLLVCGLYYKATGRGARIWRLLNRPQVLLWVIGIFWLLRNIPGHPLSWLDANA